MTLDEFFARRDLSRRIFDALSVAIADLGPSELRVTSSQVAFRRRVGFARAWVPGKYLRGDTAPLVLTLALRRRDASPRWKEVVEPTAGRYGQHLDVRSPAEIDAEVRASLAEAWPGRAEAPTGPVPAEGAEEPGRTSNAGAACRIIDNRM